MDIFKPASENEVYSYLVNCLNYFIDNSHREYNDEHNILLTNMLEKLGVSPLSNLYQRKKRILAIITVLKQIAGKTNMSNLYGESNAGKTLVVTVLCADLKVGAFHQMWARSNFWLQHLPGKDIYVGEEIQLDEFNADYAKLLFEGNPTLVAEVKNQAAQQLPSKPVLTTANFPIWNFTSRNAPAIRNRCVVVYCSSKIPYVIQANYHSYPNAIKKAKYWFVNSLYDVDNLPVKNMKL